MIGRRDLPHAYQVWNHDWGAPLGFQKHRATPIIQRLQDSNLSKYGVFGFQGNNSTRQVEFPWAYFHGQTGAGTRVVEVGGALSGLQFVLSKEDCEVTNVDPGTDRDQAWDGSREEHVALNRAFNTNVVLVQSRMEDYEGESNSTDRVFCISVIEHLDDEAAAALMQNIQRILRPGGLCIMTVDLCLDIYPFNIVRTNSLGTNKSIAALVSASGLDLACGHRDELFGFPEFRSSHISQRVSEFFVGDFYIPVVPQMIVLQKRLS